MKSLQEWVDKGGRAADLARITNTPASNVSDWINGKRPIPQNKAPIVASFTGVPVEALKPDVTWLRLRGRPVIDPAPEFKPARIKAKKVQ